MSIMCRLCTTLDYDKEVVHVGGVDCCVGPNRRHGSFLSAKGSFINMLHN
jgi:hypothetical protein